MYKAPCLPVGVFISEVTAIMDEVNVRMMTEGGVADRERDSAAVVASTKEASGIVSQDVGTVSVFKLNAVELSKFRSVSAQAENTLCRFL